MSASRTRTHSTVTPPEVAISALAKGTVWAGAWIDTSLFVGIDAHDDLDTYGDNIDINGLDGGNGFASVWADNTLG